MADNSQATASRQQPGALPASGVSVLGPAIFFVGLGLLFVVLGWGYSFGTSREIGPGAFPVALGAILVVLGVGVALEDLLGERATLMPLAWRPLLVVLGAVSLFAFLLERVGFLIAAIVLLAAGFVAAGETRWRRIAAISIAVSVGAAFLFYGALRVSFPLLP